MSILVVSFYSLLHYIDRMYLLRSARRRISIQMQHLVPFLLFHLIFFKKIYKITKLPVCERESLHLSLGNLVTFVLSLIYRRPCTHKHKIKNDCAKVFLLRFI